MSVTVDNGPEFVTKVLDEWAYRRQLSALGIDQKTTHCGRCKFGQAA
jgi:hypothetical protein